MEIEKFNSFRESSGKTLRYSCLDWDDNILKMPTKINMEKRDGDDWSPISISTEHFAEVRSDKENWRLGKNPFIEFSDDGPRGDSAFIQDMISAIGGSKYPDPPVKIAPSWFQFIETIISGELFSIITARGHGPETIRKGVEWIIENYLGIEEKRKMYNNCLTFYYVFKRPGKFEPSFDKITNHPLIKEWLDHCGFYGVSNPEFIKKNSSNGADSPEKGKEIALKEFVSKGAQFANEIGAKFKAGMSDDDMKNVLHMKTVLSELKKMYPSSELTLFDTSGGGYRKTDINESSHQAAGTESSIIPFSQYNSLQSRLFPSNDKYSDPTQVKQNLEADHLGKISKSIRKKRKK